MKKLIFCFSIIIAAACIATAQGSVSIAATNGGSVTLTPDGVTRSAPPVGLTKSIASTKQKVPAAGTATKDTKATKTINGQLSTYSFTLSSVAEARLVFYVYRGVRDDENATAADLANFDAIRKFIVDIKDVAVTKKTLTVDIPSEKVDRIFQNGMTYNNRKEMMRQLRLLETEEKLYLMALKQETDANVPEEKSKIRYQKQKYEQ